MTKSLLQLRAVALPILVLGVLQLSGCTASRGTTAPPPPGGVYFSTSAGALFEQSVTLTDQESISNIASFNLQKAHRAADDPDKIYIASGEQGIVRSADGGQTWQLMSTPLAFVSDVALLPGNIQVAAGLNGEGQGFIVRSADDGKSWDIVLTVPVTVERRRFELLRGPAEPEPHVVSLEIDPFHRDRVYAGTTLGTIFVGEQYGKTWRTAHVLDENALIGEDRQGLLVTDIVPSPHQESEILVITSARTLIRITPTEQERIVIPGDLRDPAFYSYSSPKKIFEAMYVPNFPNGLFVGVDDGAVISRDSGKTWELLALPIDQTTFNTVAVAVSPTNPARMLVAINSVVYRSEDGGNTWQTFSLNLPEQGITSLLIDPRNAANVLAVTTPL